MFAVVKGVLHVAREGDERDHKTWFRHEGWEKDFSIATRGFFDETGIYAYSGDGYHASAFTAGALEEHADILLGHVRWDRQTPVWNGMKPGEPGKRWEPIERIGTIGDLVVKREEVLTKIRLRPETLERLRSALGDKGDMEAVALFVRRAIGTGAEERVVALLQKECSPHDNVKIGAGQQSAELFECKRCGAQWWD